MSRLAYSDVQEGCQLDDSDDEAVGDSLVLSTNDPTSEILSLLQNNNALVQPVCRKPTLASNQAW